VSRDEADERDGHDVSQQLGASQPRGSERLAPAALLQSLVGQHGGRVVGLNDVSLLGRATEELCQSQIAFLGRPVSVASSRPATAREEFLGDGPVEDDLSRRSRRFE